MVALDFTPPAVDLNGYAGDTIVLKFTASDPALVAGGVWSAQVKKSRVDETPLQEFTVQNEGDGATLTLDASQTAALCPVPANPTAQEIKNGVKFLGVWDCQVVVGDVTHTVCQGKATISLDVTRGA